MMISMFGYTLLAMYVFFNIWRTGVHCQIKCEQSLIYTVQGCRKLNTSGGPNLQDHMQ